MQAREPSMEDILASIKKVIAEEKELRTAIPHSEDEPDETAQDDPEIADELLIEEISIDGMCGVY